VIFHLTNLDVHLLQTPSTVTTPVALQYYPHGPETQLYSVKISHIEKYKENKGDKVEEKRKLKRKRRIFVIFWRYAVLLCGENGQHFCKSSSDLSE
jgi:hypothetical protein